MTEEHRRLKAGLLKTLWLIREYLPDIVIGGGWAPLIYYHYLLGDKSRFPILTKDIDIMVDEKVPVRKSRTLGEILTEAGLRTEFGDLISKPPIVHYEGEIDGIEVEIEFLTNLRGKGEQKSVEVQKGLYAEALRYISISVENSQNVIIDDLKLKGISQEITVRVPSPAAFLFHKGVTFTRRRENQKKGKDLYYMFDVLVNCSDLEALIESELRSFKANYIKWFSTFISNLDNAFSDESSEGVILVQSQRTEDSFSTLDDDQFKQYVFGTFSNLLDKLNSL